jgi:hypothetical protein
MKKSTSKLALRSQTLRLLTGDALRHAVGGDLAPVENGFIMKDSIIVRTSRIAPVPTQDAGQPTSSTC